LTAAGACSTIVPDWVARESAGLPEIRTTCKRLRISDGLRPDFSRKSHRVKALRSPETKERLMSTWDIALVREQGVDFAVIAVQDHVLHNRAEAQRLMTAFSFEFGRPAVLLGARQHQTFGRPDIVRFLQGVHLNQLPWQRMTLAA
jgi:hypothetical protein